jgi:hypothetical protein
MDKGAEFMHVNEELLTFCGEAFNQCLYVTYYIDIPKIGY